MRKGSYFFVIDAFVAGIIITGAIIMLFSQFAAETSQTAALYTAEDLLLVAETTVQNLDDDLVRTWISNGTINETWRTVLEQLAYFNATGSNTEAAQLAQLVVDDVPENVGTRLRVNGAVAAEKATVQETEADVFFTSKRIVLVRTRPEQIYDPVVVEVNTWQ